MLFLIELDHVKSGQPLTPEQGRTFIEQVILRTLARGEELAAERKIVAGGAAAGRISLRFIIDVGSPQEADKLVSSIPLWPLAETRVTPLVAFADRRESVQALLANLKRQMEAESRGEGK
jgi:muconolactone delta-isomerase